MRLRGAQSIVVRAREGNEGIVLKSWRGGRGLLRGVLKEQGMEIVVRVRDEDEGIVVNRWRVGRRGLL